MPRGVRRLASEPVGSPNVDKSDNFNHFQSTVKIVSHAKRNQVLTPERWFHAIILSESVLVCQFINCELFAVLFKNSEGKVLFKTKVQGNGQKYTKSKYLYKLMQKKIRNMTLSINHYNETLFIRDYTQF